MAAVIHAVVLKPFAAPSTSRLVARPARSIRSAPFTCLAGDRTCRPGDAKPGTPETNATSMRGAVLGAVAAALLFLGPPALAFGPVSVAMSDVNVAVAACKRGTVTVTGGENFDAVCLKVTATATNPSSKPLFNADVFGRVYDATGEPALDALENARISYISEIPPGQSPISFQLIIAKEQADYGPVKVVGLKATGFPGKMLPGQGSGALDECDADLADLGECDPEASLIR